MKMCKKCLIGKQLDEFYKQKENKDGRQGSCKQCMNEVTKDWYANHPKRKKVRTPTCEWPEEKRRKRLEYVKQYKERRALAAKGTMCRRCSFVPEDLCQLTIDHIDRNHRNNCKDNLQTLCANCHYLKTKVEMTTPEKLKILNLVPSSGTL